MKRAVYLISRFGVFEGSPDTEEAQEELVAMGARAVPDLVAALAHREHGWQAACTLFEIGEPARRAIPALLKHAGDPRSNSETWSARALGRLGMLDELFALARRKRSRYACVVGLARARPASYPLYEALLARGDRELTKMIADELRPGSAAYDPESTDLAALVIAAKSPHVAIRMDAACALGSFRTGADRARAVPVLASLLGDRATHVRRLALLGLERCRGHARSAIPQITALKRDRVKAVRDNAVHALAEITKRRPGRA